MKMKPGLTAVVVLLALAAPLAMSAETKNTLRFSLGYMKTGDGTSVVDEFDYGSYTVEYKLKSTVGVQASYEYRLSDALGLEAGIAYYKPEAEYSETLDFDDSVPVKFVAFDDRYSDRTRMMPVTVGLNWHPLRAKGPADLFVGVELAYISYGEPTFTSEDLRKAAPPTVTMTASIKNEFTWGLKAGVDYRLSPKWALTASLEYLRAKAEVESLTYTYGGNFEKAESETEELSGVELKPRPVILHVGVAYAF